MRTRAWDRVVWLLLAYAAAALARRNATNADPTRMGVRL